MEPSATSMIRYGAAPSKDEYEVTIFGPGYGEAVAVHLAGGTWLLVDSCIDPSNGRPAACSYLNAIGVAQDAVAAIVASHWHDDHVRGISAVAAAYPQADFFLPAVFNDAEALQMLAAYSGHACLDLAKGTKELHAAITLRANWIPVQHRSLLVEKELNGHRSRALAMTPMTPAFGKFVAHVAEYLPAAKKPINDIPLLRPNAESVVVHVQLGDQAVLLGSDLEEHPDHGWSALAANAWCISLDKAAVFKVAHHGSDSAHHDTVWSTLLAPRPIAAITPFHLGRHKLPNPTDRKRIKALASASFISSKASTKPQFPADRLKRLNDICMNLAPVNSGFGAVRLRRSQGEQKWRAELFGDAGAL